MMGRGVGVCLLLVACSDGDVAGKGGGARDGSTEEAGGQASQSGGRPGAGGGASGGQSGAFGAGGAPGPADAATGGDASAGGAGGTGADAAPDGPGGSLADAGSEAAADGGIPRDASLTPPEASEGSVADTGASLPDASFDVDASSHDASSHDASSHDASDASRACSYPTLGIERLASSNAAYVLASLVRIEWVLTEMARVAATSLVTETRADTLPSGEPLEITAHFTQALTVLPPARPICSSPGTRHVWTLSGVAGEPGATVRLADGRTLEITLGTLVREDETGGQFSPTSGCRDYFSRKVTADYVVTELQTGRSLQVATTTPLRLIWGGQNPPPGTPSAGGARTTTDHDGGVATLTSSGPGTLLNLTADGVTTSVAYEGLYAGPVPRPCGAADACEACPGASVDAGEADAGGADAP